MYLYINTFPPLRLVGSVHSSSQMHWCAYSKTFPYGITGVSVFWKISPPPLAPCLREERTVLGSTVRARVQVKKPCVWLLVLFLSLGCEHGQSLRHLHPASWNVLECREVGTCAVRSGRGAPGGAPRPAVRAAPGARAWGSAPRARRALRVRPMRGEGVGASAANGFLAPPFPAHHDQRPGLCARCPAQAFALCCVPLAGETGALLSTTVSS